ncbi:MAG: AmmeMemoRadiSam system protein B [Clostridia bacterium]|nr:AmmeMemoRadiSam system protein B [Clostridia bacterium]
MIKALLSLLLILGACVSYEQSIEFPTVEVKTTQALVYETKTLGGMVIPHHLVPLDKILGMYEAAASDEVDHVILLSPDHFTNTNREILTTDKGYKGDFGWIPHGQLNDLYTLPYVFKDDFEIQKEHGLFVHIPYIKKYFPNADLSVFAVSKQTTRKHIDEFLSHLPKNVFIIGSVDFSHYYTNEEADIFDSSTKKWIETNQFEHFFSLDDAYLDSPGVLYILLSYAKQNDMTIRIIDQGNSQDYFNSKIYETTSYFFIGLEK